MKYRVYSITKICDFTYLSPYFLICQFRCTDISLGTKNPVLQITPMRNGNLNVFPMIGDMTTDGNVNILLCNAGGGFATSDKRSYGVNITIHY